MDNDCYEEYLNLSLNYDGKRQSKFLEDLSKKHGYGSTESMRSAFRREREKRGHADLETSRDRLLESPVVAVVDIETLPLKIEGYLWGIRDQYIGHAMIKENSVILSWAAKYINGTETYSDIMTPDETLSYDSYRVTSSVRNFLDTCDFVIGHNWDEFDGKVISTEVMKHDMHPIRYRSIDTYKLIKTHFRLPSYKLGYVNEYFGIRDKLSNSGMGLWEACASGDESSLNAMMEYNIGDIFAEEDLFWYIQPHVQGIPNFNSYSEKNISICQCGGELILDSYKPLIFTNLASYERMVCVKCGSLHRGRKNLLSKQKRNSLLVRL